MLPDMAASDPYDVPPVPYDVFVSTATPDWTFLLIVICKK